MSDSIHKSNILEQLQQNKIIQHGEFVLKSGKKSNIYIDLRQIISFPKLHEGICKLLIEKINESGTPDLICGTPYGAVPYSSFISISENIPMIFLRKEQKAYGMKRQIEGNFKPDNTVVLIEDCTTTGSSVIDAAEKLEQSGLQVVKIISIVLRHPSKTFMYKSRIPVEYLWHISDILSETRVQPLSIPETIREKGTKICLAADVSTMKELYDLIHTVGDSICVLKMHADIIEDFYDNFKDNCRTLKNLKHKYKFRIWEDRKMADIGSVMKRQADHIKNWADIVSIHPAAGLESVSTVKDIDIIFIIELSTPGNILNHNYRLAALDIANRVPNVIGIVSQHKVSDRHLHFVPGINLNDRQDGMGQHYNTPTKKGFADVFVIGRGIYNSKSPRVAIEEYIRLTDSL